MGRPPSAAARTMRERSFPLLPGLPEDVLHHHHRGVHQEPKSRGPPAHEIRRVAEDPHGDEGQSMERGITSATVRLAATLRRKIQRRATTQHPPQEEILLHRVGGLVHQVGLVRRRGRSARRRESVPWSSSTRARTLAITRRAILPFRMMTIPLTTSPCRCTSPHLAGEGSGPTSATSPAGWGCVPGGPTGTSAISSSPSTRPSPG